MVEVIKSIIIKGNCEMEYLVMSDGPNYIGVYATEFGESFDYDSPLLYLSKDEGLAISRAISLLLTGF